jgi:hypothetical protein
VKILTADDLAALMQCTRRVAIGQMKDAGAWQISTGEWRISEEGWQRWVQLRETVSTSADASGGRGTRSRGKERAHTARTLKRPGDGALLVNASQPIPLTQRRKRAGSGSG